MNRVVVTGFGLITALGPSVEIVWPRILSGESSVQLLPSQYDHLPCRIASTIDEVTYNDVKNGSIKMNELKTMSRASVLIMHAAKDAMDKANLNNIKEEEQHRSGVSVGIGFDGVHDSIGANRFNAENLPYSAVGPYALTKSLGNMACAHLSLRFKLKGPARSVNTACAAGLHAIGDAFRTVQFGEADVMLCGGVEASISPWSIAAFSRIRALPTKFNDKPNAASRPFDSERSGFVMSEGAGALVLESLEHALSRGKQPIVELLGFGQTCDAFSLVAPDSSGDGAFRAMEAALKWAKINPSQVGYVNAHATSTPQGDAIECRAIERLLGRLVPVGSFKGSLGHCLGGSGAVETVLTAHSLATGLIAPNANLVNRDAAITANVMLGMREPLEWPCGPKIAVKNSFGFGGTNCSLVIAGYGR